MSAHRMRWAGISCLLATLACATPPPPTTAPEPPTEEELIQLAGALSDNLRHLALLQQNHHRVAGSYTNDLEDLGFAPLDGYQVVVTEATERGWAAEAGSRTSTLACSVFDGVVGAHPRPTTALVEARVPYCVRGR